MVWWQIDDMYFEQNNKKLDLDSLIKLHNKKTWALIKTSIIWWILISWYKWNIEEYEKIGKEIWLAFQIKDDLLDVEWTFEETGKSVWWEQKWFVYFMWIEKTREYLDNIIRENFDIIKKLNSEKLEFLIQYIWKRKK
jgi:geranylgeranyl diphosphate synthase type II